MPRYSDHFYDKHYTWVGSTEMCYYCGEPATNVDYTPPPRLLGKFFGDPVRIKVCQTHWYKIYVRQRTVGDVALTFKEKEFIWSGIKDAGSTVSKVSRGLYNLRAPGEVMSMPDLDSVIINQKRYDLREAVVIHLLAGINDSDLSVDELCKILDPVIDLPMPIAFYADLWRS